MRVSTYAVYDVAKFSGQRLRRHLFQQQVVGSGRVRVRPVAAMKDLEIRDDCRPHLAIERREDGDRLQPTLVQPARFDEDGVGRQLLRKSQGIAAFCRDADDLEYRVLPQPRDRLAPRDIVVVEQHQSNHWQSVVALHIDTIARCYGAGEMPVGLFRAPTGNTTKKARLQAPPSRS